MDRADREDEPLVQATTGSSRDRRPRSFSQRFQADLKAHGGYGWRRASDSWNDFSLASKAAHLAVASRTLSAQDNEELDAPPGSPECPPSDGDGGDDGGASASAPSTAPLDRSPRASESTNLSRAGVPRWFNSPWQRTSRDMPWQRSARRFYPLLFPCFAALLAATVGPPVLLLHLFFYRRGWDSLVKAVTWVPMPVAVAAWFAGLAAVVAVYAYHFVRLRGTLAPPPPTAAEPLVHAVVVCTFREPAEVLCRTFESIAEQRGLRRRPIAVLAAEARDTDRAEVFAAVQKCAGDRLDQLLYTEHELREGEIAGKSSNENFAVRELYSRLVEERGLDPFEVMVTIADSDSILSSTYLAHVESSFREQPDGRRLIYSGPLNTYRNFADAGLLIQCLEMMRCHYDTFHNPLQVPYPYSNYSLSLGFAAEIGFWTPDSMPEDIHTANKAMVNNFGSRTTVAIPPVICNDLVVGLGHRYSQAKRHQWGSVTELAWQLALYTDMKLSFPNWWAVFSAEATRGGSVLHFVGYLSSFVLMLVTSALVAGHWSTLPEKFKLYMTLAAFGSLWRWTWFWIAELSLWHTILAQFPIRRPSAWNWVALVVTMPFLSALGDVAFYMVPTLHALFHATFVGELAYVCAPKGQSELPMC